MSFTGLSTLGKEAKGFPGTLGKWSFNQYQDWLRRQNDFGNRGNTLIDKAVTHFGGQFAGGPPGVQPTRDVGKQIFDFDPALKRRSGRLNDILSAFRSGVTPAASTTGKVSGFLDTAAGDLSRTSGQINQEILDNAQRMAGISGNYTEGMIQNLRNTYGGLGERTTKGFGGLRDINEAKFGDVRSTLGEGFTNAFTDLEKTRPTGEFRAATAARSFAPEVARVNRSLRRMGIDPNSPEGVAALSNVGEQRARAVDDAIADETGRFADRSIALNLGKGEALSGATERELARELGLGEAQLGTEIGLGEDLARNVTGLQSGNLANQLAIEGDRSGRSERNLSGTLDRSKGILDQRSRNTLLKRALEQEDFQTAADIMREMNQEELLGLDLGQTQFGQGLDFTLMQRGLQDQAMRQLLGIGSQDIASMFGSANAAQGFGDQALRAQLAQYGIELPNAAWGLKLLGGLGMGALKLGTGGLARLFRGGGGGSSTADLSGFYDQFGF